MRAVQDGDEHALAEIHGRYRQRAYNYLCAATLRFEAAEDGLSLAWARLWEARRTWDPSRAFRPWFQGILVNAARDARRFDRRLFGWFSGGDVRRGRVVLYVEEPADRPDGSARDPDLGWLLQRALTKLAFADREVLLLGSQGFSVPEIAESLDISVAAATMRLSRARDRLRVALGAA